MRTAVFIFALLVRVAAIELTGAERIAFGDGPDYVQFATALCEQHVYPERGNLPFFRAPGLPFFIAGVTACHPAQTRIVKYALAVCDALSVLLIFLLALRVHGTRTHALIAAALATFHPFFIGGVTDIRTEPLFMMLLIAAMWLTERRLPAGRAADVSSSAAGALLGLAALTRPTALLCIPLLAAYAFFRRPETGGAAGRRPALRSATLLLAAAVLTLSPWVARNMIRFGEPILVNDAGGFNLWRGTHPELMQVVETHDRDLFAQRSWHFEAVTVSETAKGITGATPKARDRQWRNLAIENIRDDPAFAAKSALKKAALYWRPWLHPGEHGRKSIALSVVIILGLYILGGAGLYLHPDKRLVMAVLLFFAALWLAHVAYFPSIRLRTPLTDPLLIVFASAPLMMLRRYLPLALVVAPILAVAFVATRLSEFPAARAFVTTMQGAAGEWWAMPLFVVAYLVCAIFLLPVGLLSATAALMWGWQMGGTLELVTSTLAALVPFFLARKGLARWVEKRVRSEDAPALHSPFVLFLLRIVPLVPYVALNYIAGATRIRTRDYIVTTLVGSVPSVFLFAYFVDTMAAGAMGAATQAKIFAVCGAVAVVAIILRVIADRFVRSRRA
ncbi:MAG TPA: VTT domain-containing protein [Thermoanaerobaculia bacterium]|nr:VTT domain-containing protein [Thermoanaerobaculia bacterium]